MSKGFVKDYDDQRLDEIRPTKGALLRFLTAENNGVPVSETRSYVHPKTGKQVHEMSNGFKYAVNDDNEWFIVDDS